MSICFSIPLADAVKDGYSLCMVKKEKFRFVDVDRFLDDQVIEVLQFDAVDRPLSGGIPTDAQPYATLSYPWNDLTALETADSEDQYFHNKHKRSDSPTSVNVLRAICTATKLQGCKYLWMDMLCIRQDTQDEGREDNAWQIKRMYSMYENCKVCLVAAGGPVRLHRLAEKTSWLDRAWTLQEALAPPEVWCIFVWNSGDKQIRGGNIVFAVSEVLPGVGMTGLLCLLTANLHIDEPEITDGVNYKGQKVDVAILPDDPDSQIRCFGIRKTTDRWPILALLSALNRPKPISAADLVTESQISGWRLSVWRCITMRTASCPEDFVFATMGIFGVTVDPLVDPRTKKVRDKVYPEDAIQELLDDYLRALLSKGSRADWFAVAPELGPARKASALPLVPDVNYTRDEEDQPASTIVKKLLSYWDGFNWYLRDTLEYTVDAPNGIEVTSTAHAVSFTNLPPPKDHWEVLPKRHLKRQHDNSVLQLTRGDDEKRYAIVIGKKARYTGGTFPPIIGDTDAVLLMLVELIPFTTRRSRNIGYAWVKEDFVRGWPKMTLGIGIRGEQAATEIAQY